MPELSSLFQPGMIGKLEVKNRIVMAPLGVGYCHPEGYNTDRYTAFLTQRARGGVGLIITGVARVVSEAGMLPGSIGMYHDKLIPGFKQLVQAIKPYDAKIFMQLHHPGSRGSERAPFPTVAPSAIPNTRTGVVPKELTKGEIEQLTEAYGEAARRVAEAGFDGVEIHGGHGYLICQFLSPRTNHRTDEYGGSLVNRTKFACEIIRRVREVVGPDFPISFRMDGDEFVEGGIRIEDAVRQAPFFVDAGADVLHITGGCSEAAHWTTGTYMAPPGYLTPLAARIKKAVSVPVIVVGRLGDPVLAERVVREGMADFVAMGRALLADPELANKAKEGEFADIRPCIYCNLGCVSNRWEGLVRCTVNPVCGQEMEYRLHPAKSPKKIMVIGGGLAGMEAAKTLAERGHQVSLYEKDNRLGGQWNIVASLQPEVGALTEYLSRGLERAGVKVVLNTEASTQLVQQIRPDAVVVTTGATQVVPDVPGIDGKNVMLATDVLLGKVKAGQEVVVVGGRLVGLDVALYLAKQGKKVSLVSRRQIARDVERTFKLTLKEELIKHGVYMYPYSPVYNITENGVNVVCDHELVFLKADSVVIAVGARSEDKLAKQLEGLVPEIRTVGDAVQPRDSLAAIHEGSKVGNELF